MKISTSLRLWPVCAVTSTLPVTVKRKPWYTGSASWMYRLIVESLLGIHLEVDKLRLTPCLPADWKSFKLHDRYRETVFHITVR